MSVHSLLHVNILWIDRNFHHESQSMVNWYPSGFCHRLWSVLCSLTSSQRGNSIFIVSIRHLSAFEIYSSIVFSFSVGSAGFELSFVTKSWPVCHSFNKNLQHIFDVFQIFAKSLLFPLLIFWSFFVFRLLSIFHGRMPPTPSHSIQVNGLLLSNNPRLPSARTDDLETKEKNVSRCAISIWLSYVSRRLKTVSFGKGNVRAFLSIKDHLCKMKQSDKNMKRFQEMIKLMVWWNEVNGDFTGDWRRLHASIDRTFRCFN